MHECVLPSLPITRPGGTQVSPAKLGGLRRMGEVEWVRKRRNRVGEAVEDGPMGLPAQGMGGARIRHVCQIPTLIPSILAPIWAPQFCWSRPK